MDLHVDAWVQFTSFRGFERALKTLRGRVLQKAGAELLCEYRLGVDVTGYMTEERRRERVAIRAREAQEVRGGHSLQCSSSSLLFCVVIENRLRQLRSQRSGLNVPSSLPVSSCWDKHSSATAGPVCKRMVSFLLYFSLRYSLSLKFDHNHVSTAVLFRSCRIW